MILLTTLFVIFVCCMILLDYRRGFIVVVLAKLFTPVYVRFFLGPVSIDVFDLWTVVMLASLVIHRIKLSSISRYPFLKAFLLYSAALTVIAIFATKMPISSQIYHIFKQNLFQDMLLGFFAYMAFIEKQSTNQFINYLAIVCMICGSYGILVYLTQKNVYIESLSRTFVGENSIYSDFLNDARMGLKGRSSGTLPHPLSWAQYWCIIVSFLYLVKDYLKKNLFLIILFLGLTNIFLSGSRAAFLSLLPLFYLHYRQSDISKKSVYIMVVLIFVVIVLGFSNSGESLVATIRSLIVDTSGSSASGSSSTMRFSQIENTFNILKGKDLWFGYGSGFLASDSNLRESLTLEMRGFESVFFQKVFDSGIIGCFAFLAFLKKIYGSIKNQCGTNELSLAMFFSSYMIAILITGVQGGSFSFFLAFSLACVDFLQNSDEETETQNTEEIQ